MIRHSLRHGTALVAIFVAGSLAMAVPIAAQEETGQLAAVNSSSAGVDFRPAVEFERAILTLSKDGEVSRYEFSPGEDPFLGVFDPAGEVLADGLYFWELQLLPSRDARAALMTATTENGGHTPGVRERQTGTFAIVDGYIADPDQAEAGAGRADKVDLGLAADGSLALGERSADDLSADTDADSGMCATTARRRSPSCEAELMDALASLGDPKADPIMSAIETRPTSGDSDSDVTAGRATELLFEPSTDKAEATPPRRIYDPEGANGRPRSEEDQR